MELNAKMVSFATKAVATFLSVSLVMGFLPIAPKQMAYADEGCTEGHVACTVIENEVAATCTEDGSYDQVTYCENCGLELDREVIAVAAMGHTPEVIPAVPNSCYYDGSTEGSVCSTCGTILVAPQRIPVHGHGYLNGKCVTCGSTDPRTVPITAHVDYLSETWLVILLRCYASDPIGTTLSYKWQYSPNGRVWADASRLTGSSTPTLHLTNSGAWPRYYYRCVVTAGYNRTVTTEYFKMDRRSGIIDLLSIDEDEIM